MKPQNILFSAPAWLSNSLSLVIVLLLTITTVGQEIIQLFTEMNCEQCLITTKKVLTIFSLVLVILKVFMKATTKNDTVAIVFFMLGIGMTSCQQRPTVAYQAPQYEQPPVIVVEQTQHNDNFLAGAMVGHIMSRPTVSHRTTIVNRNIIRYPQRRNFFGQSSRTTRSSATISRFSRRR